MKDEIISEHIGLLKLLSDGHTPTKEMIGAMIDRAEESKKHHDEAKFAAVSWTVDDVHEHRSNCDWPEWTDEQAAKFLRDHASTIQADMCARGWDSIETLMTEGGE